MFVCTSQVEGALSTLIALQEHRVHWNHYSLNWTVAPTVTGLSLTWNVNHTCVCVCVFTHTAVCSVAAVHHCKTKRYRRRTELSGFISLDSQLPGLFLTFLLPVADSFDTLRTVKTILTLTCKIFILDRNLWQQIPWLCSHGSCCSLFSSFISTPNLDRTRKSLTVKFIS